MVPRFSSVLRELAFGERSDGLGAVGCCWGLGETQAETFLLSSAGVPGENDPRQQGWLPALLPQDSAISFLLSFPYSPAWILASIPTLPSRSSKDTQLSCSLSLIPEGTNTEAGFSQNAVQLNNGKLDHLSIQPQEPMSQEPLRERCTRICVNSIDMES